MMRLLFRSLIQANDCLECYTKSDDWLPIQLNAFPRISISLSPLSFSLSSSPLLSSPPSAATAASCRACQALNLSHFLLPASTLAWV